MEIAQPDFTPDDLLLVRDDIDDFECLGVDQAQVETDIHDIELAIDDALAIGGVTVADEGVGAERADVVVKLGDAADEIEVRARDLTGEDATEVLAVFAD